MTNDLEADLATGFNDRSLYLMSRLGCTDTAYLGLGEELTYRIKVVAVGVETGGSGTGQLPPDIGMREHVSDLTYCHHAERVPFTMKIGN